MSIRWTVAVIAVLAGFQSPALSADPIDIGSRRELFVDEYLIEKLQGAARRQLQTPRDKGVVFVCDKPWEGNTSGYMTIFRDGDGYRMYYRGWHHEGKETHPAYACLAESRDGIRWTRPDLGLVAFGGSKKNNILLADGYLGHNFVAFKDTNPACPANQRYKAVGGHAQGRLYGLVSPDGAHWRKVQDKPILTQGAFDSQNLVFWDAQAGEYRAYFRNFRKRVRDIMTSTSKDFVTWSGAKWLVYPGAPTEQLYTNQIRPYDRAPHLFIGFPTRLTRGNNVEGLFMSSRDGVTFKRWGEAVIRAGRNTSKWGNRSNYIWYGVVETESDLPGGGKELSVYSGEAYYRGPAGRVRRHVYRLDGFVSVNAPLEGGSLTTKPIAFRGSKLYLNYSTAAAGSITIELLDTDSQPVREVRPKEMWGDATDQPVPLDFTAHQGKPVRLRFTLKDADLFAFQFRD